MLILDFDDSDPAGRKVEEETVGLAPLKVAHVTINILKPKARDIALPKHSPQMFMQARLIPNPLGSPAPSPRVPPGKRGRVRGKLGPPQILDQLFRSRHVLTP